MDVNDRTNENASSDNGVIDNGAGNDNMGVDNQDRMSTGLDNSTDNITDNINSDTDGFDNDNNVSTDTDDAPDWFLKDKFKSVEDQAKSYGELQKKMGKYWGAPKDNYSIEDIEGIDSDDPMLESIMPEIKEMGLSQDGFKSLVGAYQKAQQSMAQKFEQDLKQSLTVEDAQNYKAIDGWMQQRLSPEEIKIVQNNWLMSPEDFKLFNQLRLMAAPSTNVPSPQNSHATFESSESVTNEKIKYKTELREGKIVKDKNLENELSRRFRDARTRELRNNR